MKDEYARAACRCCRSCAASARRAARSCSTRAALRGEPAACAGAFGATYLVASVLLGAAFIYGAVRLLRRPERRNALRLYLYSLAYLAALFAAMVVDARL